MNEGKIEVSFIVPVFNMETSLGKCLDSIAFQTVKEIEIIVIDDGSTDRSGYIADEYAKKDKRIRVIHKENSGIADAFNLGLELVKGENVLFVDSDDYIEPMMVETMLSEMKKDDFSIVQCGYVIENEEGKVLRKTGSSEICIVGAEEILEKYFTWSGISGNLSAKLIQTKLIRNILFPSGRLYADIPVLPELFSKCKRYKIIRETFYHIITHPESASRKRLNENTYEDIIYSINRVSDFMKLRFPRFDNYVCYMKASTAALQYERVKKSYELEKREEKLQFLKIMFQENYSILKKSEDIKLYSLVRRLQLALFQISPFIAILAEKVYRIIKKQ